MKEVSVVLDSPPQSVPTRRYRRLNGMTVNEAMRSRAAANLVQSKEDQKSYYVAEDKSLDPATIRIHQPIKVGVRPRTKSELRRPPAYSNKSILV